MFNPAEQDKNLSTDYFLCKKNKKIICKILTCPIKDLPRTFLEAIIKAALAARYEEEMMEGITRNDSDQAMLSGITGD